jgi:hypothetical protein
MAKSADEGGMIMEVRVDVDPDHEEEFNRWYDEVHLPDMMGCPGFRRARRFVAAPVTTKKGAPPPTYTCPKYVALYEIDSEEVLQTPEFQDRRGWGHLQPYVKNPQIFLYRKITEVEG